MPGATTSPQGSGIQNEQQENYQFKIARKDKRRNLRIGHLWLVAVWQGLFWFQGIQGRKAKDEQVVEQDTGQQNLTRRARSHNKSAGQRQKPMTEHQFLDSMSHSQRRFESLRIGLIRKMNDYTFTTKVRDSAYYKTIDNYAMNISLVAEMIWMLNNFNSDKYNNLAKITDRYENIKRFPVARRTPKIK